jgi:hypothetical protein
MRRQGVALVEVLLALALIAGPLLLVVSLTHSSARGSRRTTEQAEARLLALDLAELALSQHVEELRAWAGETSRLRRTGADARSQDALAASGPNGRLPLPAGPFAGRVRVAIDEDAGGVPDFVRLTVTIPLASGDPVVVVRHFRPGARVAP